MLRFAWVAIAAFALVFAACGNDDDDNGTPNATSTADVTATSPAGDDANGADDSDGNDDGEPEPTPTRAPLPTPTPLPETGIALQVGGTAASSVWQPTLADFRVLPTVDLALPNGETVSGVLIETLAAEVGATEATNVTIEGIIGGVSRHGFITGPYTDAASTTVVTVSDEGRLRLFSTHFPENQWLDAVVTVAFQ